jgi:hypothetical protein
VEGVKGVRLRVAIVVLLIGGLAEAQTGGNPHVKKLLDNFATACGVATDRNERHPQVFVPGSETSKWRLLSTAELKNCEQCMEFALVWRGSGRKHLVRFENTSESGDWYQYEMYCYERDGSLMSAISDINTAWDWAVVHEFKIQAGKLSAMPAEYRSTATWTTLPRPVEPMDVDEFWKLHTPKLYRHLSEWPFYSLMAGGK